MNKVIAQQLERVKAPLPEYDSNTRSIHIDRKQDKTHAFIIGKSYLIEVADYIIKEPPNFTLSSNWNRGVCPVSKHLLIYVIELHGAMVKVMARGFNVLSNVCLGDIYEELWLPVDAIVNYKEI